jgi:hypothetical protein
MPCHLEFGDVWTYRLCVFDLTCTSHSLIPIEHGWEGLEQIVQSRRALRLCRLEYQSLCCWPNGQMAEWKSNRR